jgi:hypothetical protein
MVPVLKPLVVERHGQMVGCLEARLLNLDSVIASGPNW